MHDHAKLLRWNTDGRGQEQWLLIHQNGNHGNPSGLLGSYRGRGTAGRA